MSKGSAKEDIFHERIEAEEDRCKVVSYRVRELNNDQYVVEAYTMRLEDEISFYEMRYTAYYIRYDSYVTGKDHFQAYIRRKCDDNWYDFGFISDEEPFNFFLATHYFPQRTLDRRDNRLERLNEYAQEFMEAYNESLDNQDEGRMEELLVKAKHYLHKGIDYIDCINVGQANFSIGYSRGDGLTPDRACAVFDIGIKNGNAGRAYPKKQLEKLDGRGIVVISHYDSDHINGQQYITAGEILDRIWILPERRCSPTPTERNLLVKLKSENCIFLKDIDYAKTPFNPGRHVLEIGNLKIYRGNAQKADAYQSTNKNARCLMCLIKKESSVLLPADCLYEEFPTSFQVDYMVIPHHCCFYDQTIKNVCISQLRRMIVFAGPNKGYHQRQLRFRSQKKSFIYICDDS